MEIKELTKKEFDDFIQSAQNTSLYQTSAYGMAMENQNYRPIYVGLFNGGTIVAGTLILITDRGGFDYGYCPRGFIIDYNDFELVEIWTKELKRFLSKYNLIAIKLCPLIEKSTFNYDKIFDHMKRLDYYHFGYNYYFEALKPRYEAVINLDTSLESLFFNIKKEYRTKIRAAANRGVKIYKGDHEDLIILHNQTRKKYVRDLKYFNDLYLFFGDANSINIYYAKLNTGLYLNSIKNEFEAEEEKNDRLNRMVLQNMSNNLNLVGKKMDSDKKFSELKTKLIEATNLNSQKPDGSNIASGLVVTHKDEAYLMIDGLDTTYKSFNGKHLLIWKLIEKYHKLGYKKFNLGGMTRPDLEGNKFEGLNSFKLAFNAEVKEYMGDLELIINNAKYNLFVKSNRISGILKR